MSMQYWDPFEDFFNRYTRSGRGSGWQGSSMGHSLPVDLCETDDEYIVRAAVPGIKPEDLDITVKEDVLTISGTLGQPDWMQQRGHDSQAQHQQSSQGQQQSQHQNQGGFYCWMQEIPTGKFSRSFTLPTELNGNNARAEFDNGMLVLHLPKAEEAKPRRIQVHAGGQQHQQLPVGQGQGKGQGGNK